MEDRRKMSNKPHVNSSKLKPKPMPSSFLHDSFIIHFIFLFHGGHCVFMLQQILLLKMWIFIFAHICFLHTITFCWSDFCILLHQTDGIIASKLLSLLVYFLSQFFPFINTYKITISTFIN